MTASMNLREKRIFFAALLVAGFFALDRLGVLPSQTESGGLTQRLAREEIALARERRLLSEREEIMRSYKNFFSRAPVPREGDDRTVLLGEIEALARRSRVTLTDMKPRTEGGGTSFVVSIQTEGSWRSFCSFLLAVEESPHLLKVDKGTVRAKNDDSTDVEAQLTISRKSTES